MRKYSYWSCLELESLKNDFSKLNKTELEIKYNRKYNSIQVKANKLGLKKPFPSTNKKYNLKFSKEEIIELYKSGKTIIDISNLLNCTPQRIYQILKQYNIKIHDQSLIQRKYTLNNNIFKSLNPETAYILGILYADGYHNVDRHEINLSLNTEDKDILEKINVIINSNKPLQLISNKQYRISIYSKQISDDLLKYGLYKNKTFKLEFPKLLDLSLYNHFIRGYFDGDGCITLGKNPSFSLVGTIEFLEIIQEILIKNCKLNKTKFDKRHKEINNNITSLRYCGRNNVIKIRGFLYNNSTIHMNRKYNKFNDVNG